MNIQEFIKVKKVTHKSYAHNYTNKCEISSVHYFNADGFEVGYVVPTIYSLTKTVVECLRLNPIDSINKVKI